MIRRWVLWGLTIILVAALAVLIYRARKLEKAQATPERTALKGMEESSSTPTRVYSPQDLEIVEARVRFDSGRATHHASIRNVGRRSYCSVGFGISYRDRAGNTLMTRRHVLEERVKPGGEIMMVEVSVSGAPANATTADMAIMFAEIGEQCSHETRNGQRR